MSAGIAFNRIGAEVTLHGWLPSYVGAPAQLGIALYPESAAPVSVLGIETAATPAVGPALAADAIAHWYAAWRGVSDKLFAYTATPTTEEVERAFPWLPKEMREPVRLALCLFVAGRADGVEKRLSGEVVAR